MPCTINKKSGLKNAYSHSYVVLAIGMITVNTDEQPHTIAMFKGEGFVFLQEGIQPMWEDDQNKKGGRWLINLDKKKRHLELDAFWLETVCITMLHFLAKYSI